MFFTFPAKVFRKSCQNCILVVKWNISRQKFFRKRILFLLVSFRSLIESFLGFFLQKRLAWLSKLLSMCREEHFDDEHILKTDFYLFLDLEQKMWRSLQKNFHGYHNWFLCVERNILMAKVFLIVFLFSDLSEIEWNFGFLMTNCR